MTSMASHQPNSPCISYPPSYHHKTTSITRNSIKPRTIEVNLGTEKLIDSLSQSREYPEFSPQIRAKILTYLASTNLPFPLSLRNSNRALDTHDILDLRQLLCLSGEDRWWEIDLDLVYCEKCVRENIKPHWRPTVLDKIPLVADVAKQVTTCLSDQMSPFSRNTSRVSTCVHETTFAKLMREIDHETRCRLSCLRIKGSFSNHTQVGSAIQNILQLFPNIQSTQVILPSISRGPIPNPEKIAYHLSTLENSLPKGVALVFTNLLEHHDLLLKWVQVKRKWYQLIPNDTDVAHMHKIGNISGSEEKIMGIGVDSINWSRLNRDGNILGNRN